MNFVNKSPLFLEKDQVIACRLCRNIQVITSLQKTNTRLSMNWQESLVIFYWNITSNLA